VLRDCLDLPTLKNALSSLPYDLDETYQRILSNLVSHPGYERNAVRLLQFLTYSKRPLRLEEAIDAIAVYPNLGSYENSFSTDNRLPNPDEIIRYCSSLVKVTKRKGKLYNHRKRALGEKRTISELQLAHFSVKEYLVSARVQERFKEPLSETRAKAAIVEVSISYMLVAAPNYGQVDHNELPLVELAAKYWTEHARKAEVDHETVVAWSQKLCETTDALSLCQDINKDFECEAFLTLRDGRREGFANPLYYASLAGLSQTAKKLLDEGAEVNTMIGGTFNFALTAAAYNGHTVVARLLLDRGADIEAVSKISGSALYAASSQGHKAVVECLLDKGADIEAASSKFGSALFAASSHGHRAVVGFLLDKGADIEAASSKFGSALYAASLHGHRTVVELLLDKGAYIDRIGGKFGCPLFAASNNKHEAVVELLLDRGSSWVDLHRAFPIASQGGHECLVKMLLAKVANVGFSEPKGDALRSTSSEGDEEIVKLLLGHRADVGFREQKGDTLRFASSEGHEEIIELLLDYRAEFNFHRQGAALQVASYQGYEKGVQRLRDRGADLSFHGKYGTALQAASSDGHENLVKLLLDHGADVDFHEEYGTARPAQYGTALQAASYWGHEKVVQLLIDRGADVNLNEGFDTALQIAIKNGHETILQLLIDHGADVNASGGISGNAIEAASEMGHEKVVELLLDRGADVKFSAALQVASYVGHEKVVQLLLDRGADVNASDYDLGTAIEAASCRAHKRILTRRPIVQLLLREGASYTFNWSVGGSSTQYEYVTACQCVSDDEQETGSDDEIDSEEIDGEDADSEETDHSRRKNDRGWNSCSITL
jgi:ankyrin repeat protein